MKTVTITKLRNKISTIISEIEKGETVQILRHGKAVAEILPLPLGIKELTTSSWKKPGLKLSVKGASLSKAILDERKSSLA